MAHKLVMFAGELTICHGDLGQAGLSVSDRLVKSFLLRLKGNKIRLLEQLEELSNG